MTDASVKKLSKGKGANQAEAHLREKAQGTALDGRQIAILPLQNAAGNQAVSRLLRSGTPSAWIASDVSQRKRASSSISDRLSPSAQEVLRSQGQPLDPVTRSVMESRFNHDFSQVRIHTDANAMEAAQTIGARAFTLGNDIVFDPTQYSSHTRNGMELLGHELAHVAQQSFAAPTQSPRLNTTPHLEQEARVAGRQAAVGEQVNGLTSTGVQGIQGDFGDFVGQAREASGDRIIQQVIRAILGNLPGAPPPAISMVLGAALAGFFSESYRRLVQQEQALDILSRVRELADPGTAASFAGRYYWGVAQGLVSPITGLVGLAEAGIQFQIGAMNWLVSQASHAPEILRETQDLHDRFQNFGTVARQTLNDLRQRDRLLEFAVSLFSAASTAGEALERQLAQIAERKGREAAGGLVDQLLHAPLPDLAETVGKVVGTVLIELVLLFFTDGIGNLIAKVGEIASGLGRAMRFARTGAAIARFGNILSEVGVAIAEVERVIAALLNRTVLRPLQPLLRELERLLSPLRNFVRRLVGLEAEGASAAARQGAGAVEEALETSAGRTAQRTPPAATRPSAPAQRDAQPRGRPRAQSEVDALEPPPEPRLEPRTRQTSRAERPQRSKRREEHRRQQRELQQQAEEESALERQDVAEDLAERGGRARSSTSRRTERQRTQSSQRSPGQRTPEQVTARRRADSIYERAQNGEFRSGSERSKRQLLDRYERLMRRSGASPQEISSRKGRLNELLRTPTRAVQSGQAQPEFLAGGPRLPGQTRRGTARPDFTDTRRLPDGRVTRVHVNDKADNIHQLTQPEAVQTARRYTDDAVVQSRGAQIRRAAPRSRLRRGPRLGALPEGEPIVIRYTHEPSDAVQEAMVREHFRAGSPITEVHFGTTVYRRRSLNTSDFDRL